jgi:hypothetical protein
MSLKKDADFENIERLRTFPEVSLQEVENWALAIYGN